MDKFFTQPNCDRCKRSLEGGRIMSMFNEDCLCIPCKTKEERRGDYKKAIQAEIEQMKLGNYNFKGIGYK